MNSKSINKILDNLDKLKKRLGHNLDIESYSLIGGIIEELQGVEIKEENLEVKEDIQLSNNEFMEMARESRITR